MASYMKSSCWHVKIMNSASFSSGNFLNFYFKCRKVVSLWSWTICANQIHWQKIAHSICLYFLISSSFWSKTAVKKRDGQTETWLNMKFLTPPPPSRRLLSAIRTTSEPSCYWMLFKLMTNNDLELIIGLRKSKVFWSTWCRPCGMRRTPCWSARSWTCSSPPPSSSSRSQTCNRYFCHNFCHYHVHLFLSHKICFPLEILQFST